MLTFPAIEFNLTEHCNLRCAYCTHSSNYLPKTFASLASFERDITRLSRVVRVAELKMLGGEPLLHPELVGFLRVARESGIARSVVIWTNGLLLRKMPDAAWSLIDGIVVSEYPGIRTTGGLETLQHKLDKHSVWLTRKDCSSFVREHIFSPISDEGLVEIIHRTCTVANYRTCLTVHESRFYKCVNAVFLEPRLRAIGVTITNRFNDSVAITDDNDLGKRIADYLESAEPLDACRYCLGNFGPWLPHRQLGEPVLEDGKPCDLIRGQLMYPHLHSCSSRTQ